MWKASELFSRVLLGIILAAGCSSTPGTSGETHFQCSATPDCVRQVGPELVCVGGQCAHSPEGFAPADIGANVFVEGMNPDRCIPRTLQRDAPDARVPCTLLELDPESTAPCELSRMRAAPGATLRAAAEQRLLQEGKCGASGLPACSAGRMCELRQASDACRHAGPISEAGWCYVDPDDNPTDDPSLVAMCAAGERRRFRFVEPEPETPPLGPLFLIACFNPK